MTTDRRTFLQLVSTGALAAAFPASIKRALAIPAHHRTGTIADVEHIVILMQENRSFDHYFGTLRGVRGFGDPRAVSLPSGLPVWYQPNGGGYVLPFRPDVPNLGLAFIEDTAHNWSDTHQAWNAGKYDQWVPAKGTTTMAYLTREDIPFHFALADAFTICDAYHCSLMGPTDPNRYHMWTGWVGNDGKNGGPVLNNAEAGYDWSTYPERLQAAGISWKIYQDQGAGLDAAHFWGWGDDAYIGNFGDNSLLYFHQYQSSQPGSPLFEGALRGTNISQGGTLFDQLKQDVMSGNLPKVSWIVAPEAYTEHPNWPANFGAWYTSQILDALTANPEVFSKTAFFLNYDENDGLFDHMVPPTPPQSRAQGLSTVETTNEVFAGDANFAAGPYGLGVRVPMLVISPWSKGGWVDSEVFDHTSLIQFIEQRFAPEHPGLIESNITPWRRAVTGDLTSAFNFKSPNDRGSIHDLKVLPSTAAYVPPDNDRHPDFVPPVPGMQALPAQEPGTRPARAVPYELHVRGEADFDDDTVKLHFSNTGKAAAVFQVRKGSSSDGPWTYTVGPGGNLCDVWTFPESSTYDLSVYGPNGFLRAFRGSLSGRSKANLTVRSRYGERGGITLDVQNHGASHAKVRITDVYTNHSSVHEVRSGDGFIHHAPLDGSYDWYDFVLEVESDSTFLQRVAGHVETGEDSVSDPRFGKER